MRITCSIVLLSAVLGVCALGCVIALYTAGALAAAQAVRAVPFVGGIASQRIERWVLGAVEMDTIDEVPPLGLGTPLTDTRYYTGTVADGDWGPDECGQPRGLPVYGPITQDYRPAYAPGHSGVDVSVVVGTPVLATQCGIVTFAGWSDVGYGYLVVVQHGAYSTYYAHNDALYVEPGARVELGQAIASSGDTGKSTGPHVHYETRIDGVAVDPFTAFP
jgi:murein DD-endopeptidase MepM/ murein hydrolase activator NlpD